MEDSLAGFPQAVLHLTTCMVLAPLKQVQHFSTKYIMPEIVTVKILQCHQEIHRGDTKNL